MSTTEGKSISVSDCKFPNRRERWKIRLVTLAVMLFVLWTFVFGPLSWKPKPVWTKSDGSLPDMDAAWFRYIMFPRTESVQLFDTPDGKPCGTLTRAVANSPKEVEAGGWIGVLEANIPNRWVRLEDLTFVCPENADQKSYVAALNASLAARDPKELPWFEYSKTKMDDGVRVRARLWDRGWEESWYLVQGEKANPEKLILVSEGGVGISGAVDCGQGVVFSLFSGAFAAIVTRFWLKRRRTDGRREPKSIERQPQ